jgi:hypothetical protein
MNCKHLVFLLLIIPVALFADILYPDSLYVIHEDTGYKILLGTSPEFIEKEFGQPNDINGVYMTLCAICPIKCYLY